MEETTNSLLLDERPLDLSWWHPVRVSRKGMKLDEVETTFVGHAWVDFLEGVIYFSDVADAIAFKCINDLRDA